LAGGFTGWFGGFPGTELFIEDGRLLSFLSFLSLRVLLRILPGLFGALAGLFGALAAERLA